MGSSRLLGQETTVTLTLGNTLIKEMTAIKSCSLVFKGEAVKSDFLGEKNPVFDEVSDGVDIKLDYEVDDPAYFDLLERLIRRKQGLEVFQVNLNVRYNFRNGSSRFCVVPNVSFSDLPSEIPERKQKVRGSLSGMASSARFPRGV